MCTHREMNVGGVPDFGKDDEMLREELWNLRKLIKIQNYDAQGTGTTI